MILDVKNLVRSYGYRKPVLEGVSLQIGKGEVVGLLGRNGAGKTTLIRLIMGMLQPHAGFVRVFELDPVSDPVAVKRRIGYVAEDQVLPGYLSIEELLAFHRSLFPDWDADLERQLLSKFQSKLSVKLKTLSKGEARQIALICAVCHRPEFLVLDEPGGGLDPAARRAFLEMTVRLLTRDGTTILFSSHYMDDIERIAGRVVLLDGGKVLLDSATDALREDHCIAAIPESPAVLAGQLTAIPGCVHARMHAGIWHCLFQGRPEDVHISISNRIGQDKSVVCSRLPLEEMFIQLVGD
jgi:ABC-2 type transport system ATP-binding protein